MRRFLQLNSDHLVFVLLVVIAVVGRMGRPDWNFTPVAATALFAGFYFRNRLIAAMVPLAALAISDFAEPVHSSRWVMATVWAAMLLPAVLGPWLRSSQTKLQAITRGTVGALAPSALFFLTTNFAVWAVDALGGSNMLYSSNLTGLAACYAAGIPFYAKMIAGDLFYMSLLFGAYALVTSATRQPASTQPSL
ncbi:hypothetical protein NG895_00810 [Aeoliella sp. ICT_H6.2]|uniref:Uncharacterized protein n=1 Tax=Aeoliella straminimaris TaxID=2954799 RepID=A0A9X2F5A1_9BACT|nr:hypothetical protein [Aeoliella straminimaris]